MTISAPTAVQEWTVNTMDDLISRQKAINTVNAMFKACDTGIIEDFRDLILAALADLPPTLQWVPCKERLPEEDIDVLITDEDGDIDIAHYEYNQWSEDPIVEWWNSEYRTYAIAWMPLIEPYEVKR